MSGPANRVLPDCGAPLRRHASAGVYTRPLSASWLCAISQMTPARSYFVLGASCAAAAVDTHEPSLLSRACDRKRVALKVALEKRLSRVAGVTV
jgi:hypothetical protein